MSEPLGVVMIGLDHWYSAFMILDQIVAESDLRLIGIADAIPGHLEQARQKYSPDTSTDDYRQLLDREDVDLVFSFVPTSDNVEICLESLGRGKNTICVKPPAMTVHDADRLTSAAEDAGVIYSSSEVLPRLSAKNQFLKKVIHDGVIGNPVTFYHVAHGGMPRPWEGETGDSWWLDPNKVPGGAWLDHAIYAVDQVRWTLEREVESVSATMSRRRYSELGLEDHGVALFTLDSGITAIMEDTWIANSGTRFDRWIGTKGSLVPDSDGFVLQSGGAQKRLDPPAEQKSAVSHIAQAVRGEAKLPFKSGCSVRNLAACLAAYESSRTGKRIDL